MVLKPSLNLSGKVPKSEVYYLTLSASIGHKRQSAITSAQADDMRKPIV